MADVTCCAACGMRVDRTTEDMTAHAREHHGIDVALFTEGYRWNPTLVTYERTFTVNPTVVGNE